MVNMCDMMRARLAFSKLKNGRKKGGRGEGLFMLISASAAELEILFSQLHITMQLTGI